MSVFCALMLGVALFCAWCGGARCTKAQPSAVRWMQITKNALVAGAPPCVGIFG